MRLRLAPCPGKRLNLFCNPSTWCAPAILFPFHSTSWLSRQRRECYGGVYEAVTQRGIQDVCEYFNRDVMLNQSPAFRNRRYGERMAATPADLGH